MNLIAEQQQQHWLKLIAGAAEDCLGVGASFCRHTRRRSRCGGVEGQTPVSRGMGAVDLSSEEDPQEMTGSSCKE